MENSPAPASSPTATLLERLSQQLTTSATAQAVYGTPIERDGITVIPVAQARYGFGGGGGSGSKTGGATGGGMGAGGGVSLTPVGYIELRDGRSSFRPIRPSVLPLVAVSGAIAWLLLRSLPRLLGERREK